MLGTDEHVQLDPTAPRGRISFETNRYFQLGNGPFFYDSSNYDLYVLDRALHLYSFSVQRCRARYGAFPANLTSAQLAAAIRIMRRLGFGRWVKPGLESLVSLLAVLPGGNPELLAVARRHLDR